jgi:hypothetical protein
MDAEDPLRVPPPADVVRWAWVHPRSCNMAATHFDEDDDPHLVEVPHDGPPRVLSLLLLHELSHIRNPRARCDPPDRWWREEQRRLAVADAFTRERVF